MKWPTHWPKTLLLLLSVQEIRIWICSDKGGFVHAAPWTTDRKLQARNRTRSLWYHGYDSYMRFAFPLDELAPLSCSGKGPDWYNPANIAANDVAGNFSVTLIDALDTLVVLDDAPKFTKAVRDIIDWVSFDVDTKPQVFETTIRVLGGLLSGHQFASRPGQPFFIPWYDGELLDMARDLGERLLPAFRTPSGIPYARINLRHGIRPGESFDSCTAGAGSLILEFGTLSRLTGDDRFEKAAYKAFFALWNKRSAIGLVGNTVNILTGAWTHPEVSNVGAGIDSFYEYALKWYILSGDVEFLDVFQEAYAAVMRYSRAPDGFWYRSANIHTGDATYNTVDSLSAFWPGLQVLAGDVQNAIQSHMVYWNIWKKFAGLPEVWDMNFKVATSFQYPLRPEFVESTWYLYRATRDPFYLDVGERILHDLTWRSEVECGLTGISDVRWNTRDDRMESFVLSETLKYLYLLFDEENPLHADDSNYVLTTEGHLITMEARHQKPISAIRREMRRVEHLECPIYHTPTLGSHDQGITSNIYSRGDMDYSRLLIQAPTTDLEESAWSVNGQCQIPKVDLYTYDFLLSTDGRSVVEDLHPGPLKLVAVSDGYILQNVTGIRAHIVTRLDGKGYDVTKLGPYSVKTGQIVYVNDSDLLLAPLDGTGPVNGKSKRRRTPEVMLRLFFDALDPTIIMQTATHELPTETLVLASTAMFGGDPAVVDSTHGPIQFGHGEGVRLVRDHSNPYGCLPYSQKLDGDAVVVKRGDCTFLEKLVEAALAGASGVIALSDEDNGVNPSADSQELVGLDNSLDDVAIVTVNRQDSQVLTTMLDAADIYNTQVMMAIAPTGEPALSHRQSRSSIPLDERRNKAREGNRVLYLNGHPLLNTRLMV